MRLNHNKFLLQALTSIFTLAQVIQGQKSQDSKLRNLPALKKYQIPFLWGRDNLRTGLKFKELDDPWKENRKRSHNWGSKPERRLEEIDLEDDPEKILLDHNYKSFIDNEDDSKVENNPTKDGLTKKSIIGKQEKENKASKKSSILHNKNEGKKKGLSRDGKRRIKIRSKNMMKTIARLRRAVLTFDDTVKKAKQVINNMSNKRNNGQPKAQTRQQQPKPQQQPQPENNQHHLISLNGDQKPHGAIVDTATLKQIKQDSVLESKKQAMKLLKLSQDGKQQNPIKDKVHNKIKDNKPEKRAKIETPLPAAEQKDKTAQIVPANVARAVAMAMEQLKRDKMWGKVFIHVLPSGKLKVMVQETKRIPD